MYNNRVRNIELPENLFSNLGELKSKKPILPVEKEIDEYKEEKDLKLTNYTNKSEYRDRITKMYEDIKDIKPIDNEIDNVLYFNNYIEKGIVIKPKISSLKQFWTEYRLISNEKASNKEEQLDTRETNFDKLFDALSLRVTEINKYIDELKEMRADINTSSNQLKEEKEKLTEERQKFLNYKKSEEKKLANEKENLKINFARLQTIIDDLDKKLETVDKEATE